MHPMAWVRTLENKFNCNRVTFIPNLRRSRYQLSSPIKNFTKKLILKRQEKLGFFFFDYEHLTQIEFLVKLGNILRPPRLIFLDNSKYWQYWPYWVLFVFIQLSQNLSLTEFRQVRKIPKILVILHFQIRLLIGNTKR